MDRTVRDFIEFIQRKSGCGDRIGQFSSRSLNHMRFIQKLHELGASRMDELPPELVPDIDATVILSDEQWSKLESELAKLI